MLIKVIAVGKLKDRMMRDRSLEYFKWLTQYAKLEIRELPDSHPEKEGKNILKELEKERGFVFVLSEEGQEFTSRQFAAKLGALDRKAVFVIGGPEGLSPEVKKRADQLWSLSRLTFTHEMARLFLAEQLFRAQTILHDTGYHND
ncbi:MAG: 23S rRNA (pseudouridine(1915)-N(3))-methyltransferase RlmH [Lentisphaeria bacterium]|nr:23S rRNA (pseudouridine(1915)-N(3))-methyltransferase RlmH [Lentisphaeria bacterium]